MTRFPLFAILGLGLVHFASAPTVHADAWNKKTVFDFPRPVEVPGAVLQPGRYVFKLVDSLSNRNIVMISNERENHVYATVLTIPDYRMEPRGKTVLTFYEVPEGQPEAVRSWFYPGDNYGHEFTYSKKRSLQIYAASHVVVTPPPADTSSQLKTREEPRQEVAVANEPPKTDEAANPEPAPAPPEPVAANPEPQPEQAATPTPAPGPTPSATREMPATASGVPLFGLVGLVAIGAAFMVRFLGSKVAE